MCLNQNNLNRFKQGELEKKIKGILEAMETGEVTAEQILLCSSTLAEYKGRNFDAYYKRLIKLRVK